MLCLNGKIQAMGACMTRQELRPRFVLVSGGADSTEYNCRHKAKR